MNVFFKCRFCSIVSLIVSICLFVAFSISNSNERHKFLSFNRSTIPDEELERIKSPTSLTLSFNKFYHLDSVQLYDGYGKQVINIPTICNKEDMNYSNVTAENYGMEPLFHNPLDEKQYSIIRAMEGLAGCNFSSYRKALASVDVTMFDYLTKGLPDIFYRKVYKPLLRRMFEHTFYVRTSSPRSIIKAISLNQVGKITSIHLYNGETLGLANVSERYQDLKTYEELFQASISERSKENLINAYKYRLGVNSLKDYDLEAETLANKHIEEISKALLTEKIEFLSFVESNKGWVECEKTAYPNWVNWLLGTGFFTFILSIIIICYERIQYKRLQIRLNEIVDKYPSALRKNNIPITLKDKNIGQEIVQLLNRDFSIWEKEEQEIIGQQKQIRLQTQKASELKNRYPNGWNEVKKNRPNYSDIEMLCVENEIVSEENIFQQAKKAVSFLFQVTEVGNKELIEEKNEVSINDGVKEPILDVELIETVNVVEREGNPGYNEGIFEALYVDYILPSHFIQSENWSYPVVKSPLKGTLVFPYRRHKIARRGYMENRFQAYLERQFSKSQLDILGDCAILPIDNYPPYEPDIAIIVKEYPSIKIDIEIDEPYSAISNQPIHFINGRDDFRDMNLNNLGWIVVRFTEYQVKTDMLGCASFIAQLVQSLHPLKDFPKSLLNQKGPLQQKRWTEIEAKVMASEKIREKYLDCEFSVVDNEQIDVTAIKQTEEEKKCAKLIKPLSFDLKVKKSANESAVFERDSCIQFLPIEHIYLYNGQEQFIPVSSIIACFFKPFDSFYWSQYKADLRHVPQGQVLEEWDVKGACSRDVGTFMHLQIENYYKGLPYQQKYLFKYKGKYVHKEELINLECEYMQFMEFLRKHEFKPFRTEWTIYDEELKIAGTIDMIHKRRNVFDIYDWKRSHRIVNFMGEPIVINNYGEKGLDELHQIEDTPYWHYCIQQNLYRYILEKNYGIKVEKMYLVVFSDNTNKYSKLDVPYMDEAIASIIKVCKDGSIRKRLISLQGENWV